ncbi:MAG TPA: metallopeptidase family protein [Candidatus Saccharimonadales bacterium]|nr:metallopeptidase family protein [Candidatus Saccharimonadales bacterium]
MAYHVTAEEFEEMVRATLDRVEAPLRARMDADNLMITVQQAPSDDDRENGIDEHVLGFYQGTSGSTFSAYEFPKRIVLLQGNIERWCSTRTELVAQISDTVLHEVAHYFGMNHRDIGQTRLRH